MLKTRLIIPLAFASVAFLWGCQEQASELVGPDDGVATQGTTQAAKGGSKGKPPKNDSEGATVTVTLTGGMEGELTNVKVFSDNNKKFAMNTTASSTGTIKTNFADASCEVEGPVEDDPDELRQKRLKAQLNGKKIDVEDLLFSLFNVKVDRTTEAPARGNDLQVTYDPDGGGLIILGWAHRDRAAVSEDPDEGTFTFSVGRIRVGEDEGRSRDRIRLLCPSANVTVTVD